jgi:hypothetical protein
MNLMVSVLLASLVVSSAPLAPQTSSEASRTGALSLRWNELAPVIQGQRVAVSLTDGRTVRGEVMAVRDDALVVDISRGSVPGDGTIPRASVTTIRLKRTPGGWGRHLGTVLGVLSGLVIGGWVTAETTDSAGTGIPLFLGVASAMTVGGYYAGKQLDQKETVIQVVP